MYNYKQITVDIETEWFTMANKPQHYVQKKYKN